MRRPVCMLVHAYYDEDPRVRRQAEALVRAGRPVDVLALRRPTDSPTGVLHGVRVHRLAVRRHQGAGIATYVREYLEFLARALVELARRHARRRYALVQVHTPPDLLALAALPLRIAGGVPLVLDLHEHMPELFRARFPQAASPSAVGLLHLQERVAVAVADRVLTVNAALADGLRARYASIRHGPTVILNTPDLRWFDPGAHAARAFMAHGVLRLVYAGALTPLYELDVVLDAIEVLAARRPDLRVELDVYGRGDSAPALRERAARGTLAGRVRLHGRIPIETVARAIAFADVGLAPTRRSTFTEHSLSTKIFEYAVMGKPVVATALPTLRRYLPADTVETYPSGDAAGLAAALERLVDDPEGRQRRVDRTRAVCAALGWEREGARYVALIEQLIAARAVRDAPAVRDAHGRPGRRGRWGTIARPSPTLGSACPSPSPRQETSNA